MGFVIHFYIIFGTSLLTQRPSPDCCFLPISGFYRKGISNGVQTEWNLRERYFWRKSRTRSLRTTSGDRGLAHEGGGAPPYRARPLPRGPHVWPPVPSFLLYIPTYPKTIGRTKKTLVPPPHPSIPVRSHLGACFGAPPEGGSTTECFYIIIIASPWVVSSLPQTFGSIASI